MLEIANLLDPGLSLLRGNSEKVKSHNVNVNSEEGTLNSDVKTYLDCIRSFDREKLEKLLDIDCDFWMAAEENA